MSDRRSFLRKLLNYYQPATNDAASVITISARETTSGRMRRGFAHLAPISLTPVEPLDLPVANRNSA